MTAETPASFTKAHIRAALGSKPSAPSEDMLWLAGSTPELQARVRAALPTMRVPAAVLVPLIDRPSEIGLAPEHVEFAGYLPDHLVGTGFRVTPGVGFVDAGHALQLAAAEVHDAFEVPLDFVLDAANHQPRLRTIGGVTLETHDIPYGDRIIWGATAGMLMTLRRLLRGAP